MPGVNGREGGVPSPADITWCVRDPYEVDDNVQLRYRIGPRSVRCQACVNNCHRAGRGVDLYFCLSCVYIGLEEGSLAEGWRKDCPKMRLIL